MRRVCHSQRPLFSFNFNSSVLHNQIGAGSYIQLLPLTQVDEAWVDFAVSRMTTLGQSPYNVDPSILLQLFPELFED